MLVVRQGPVDTAETEISASFLGIGPHYWNEKILGIIYATLAEAKFTESHTNLVRGAGQFICFCGGPVGGLKALLFQVHPGKSHIGWRRLRVGLQDRVVGRFSFREFPPAEKILRRAQWCGKRGSGGSGSLVFSRYRRRGRSWSSCRSGIGRLCMAQGCKEEQRKWKEVTKNHRFTEAQEHASTTLIDMRSDGGADFSTYKLKRQGLANQAMTVETDFASGGAQYLTRMMRNTFTHRMITPKITPATNILPVQKLMAAVISMARAGETFVALNPVRILDF